MMAPNIAPFHAHNHDTCAKNAITNAEMRAESEGLRLTPVRRRVLEILVEEHRALGAYEVLERLRAEGLGNQPPIAYRALDFLVKQGFAHRIRRLNAFTACMAPGEDHAPVFLICEVCDSVVELAGTQTAKSMRAETDRIGFEVSRMNIEAVGVCPACNARPDQ